jgi:hypothetical protein
MQQKLSRIPRRACTLVLAATLAATSQLASTGNLNATTPTFGQRDAALQFLQAVATGDPQVVAQTIHPDDLRALRLRILNLLREEAKKNDSTLRDRLFGAGKGIDELEHLTDFGFYATLSDRLFLASREFSSAEGIAAIPDKGGKVQVVLRGVQPRGRGKVEVVNVVTIKPWGKDWKATLPTEIEAQIDDLIEGRRSALAARSPAAQRGGRGTSPAAPGIVELLKSAEQMLTDGKCDEYYGKAMSPNFRRVTGKKALEALINSCKNSVGTREMLLTTLHLVRNLDPRYEFEGQRASYDLSGQGLPFDRFVLEQVDKHWYVAE